MADNRLRNWLDRKNKSRDLTRDRRETISAEDFDGNGPQRGASEGSEDLGRRARNVNLYAGKVRQPGLVRQGSRRPLNLLWMVVLVGVLAFVVYYAVAA